MTYPLSEQTIIRHKFKYKGLKYINDLGEACLYRIVKDNKDTGVRVMYYQGRKLVEFKTLQKNKNGKNMELKNKINSGGICGECLGEKIDCWKI